MKFQILTYQRKKDTVDVADPFVAMAIGAPWPIDGDRFYGSTPEKAREKLIKAAQFYMDRNYTNLTVTEVEIAPRAVDMQGVVL
jgi:hypothetical protein